MEPLARVQKALSRLPSVGRRSAERMALKLVESPDSLLNELVAALQEVKGNVVLCSRCGNVTCRTEDPCRICRDASRDEHVLCVVESPGDIALIERAGSFRGRYHALLGVLSPRKGVGLDDIRIRQLFERVEQEGVAEVILALNADVESDATASFLHDQLIKKNINVSRIASGIPAGSGLSYSDPVTLARAIQGRQAF